MSEKQHIVVIGAGVTGLTNAVFLAEAGYLVTVIAAHVPGDESVEYTSPWAGAHWRTHATADQPELCDWDVQTHEYWMDLVEREAKSSKVPKSGLKLEVSNHYWDGEVTEKLWWKDHVLDYRELDINEEPVASLNANKPAHAPKISFAATSKAFSINVPQYLLYLQERARASGAIIFQNRLPTDGGFFKALAAAEGICKALGRSKPVCFINASGLGAMKLCNDTTMFPICGQTVLVKGEAHATRTRYHGGAISSGKTSYCIIRPGSGTTILGGTKEPGNWNGDADQETTKEILERSSWIVPELLTGKDGGFEVISAQAGLRPGREGGPRVEREVVDGRRVVHAYGHAGAGYQNSVGCARKVVRLVGESLSEPGERARL